MSVMCDLLRCARSTPHFMPWPLNERPLPSCPFDNTPMVVDEEGIPCVQHVYDDAQRLFEEATTNGIGRRE